MNKNMVLNKRDVAMTTSKQIEKIFDKRHDNILRDIAEIKSKASKEFWELNFEESKYKSRGKEYQMYLMTKDGFTMLAMGFTGEKAMQFKEAYINRFNEMERFITSKLLAKNEFPTLTDNIKLMHEEPKGYHYSNEVDMINRIVLGKSASEYRKENNIPKGKSIRPYLNSEEIDYIHKLQSADIGMVIAIPLFEDRKEALKKYYNMLKNQNNLKLI